MISAIFDRLPQLLAAVCVAAAAFGAFGPVAVQAIDEKPVREMHGGDIGGDAMMICVVRDKATWDAVKKAMGPPHEHPGAPVHPGLGVFDAVDFQKDMIVAVFWGSMNFSGHGEDCRISGVKSDEKEITVECLAKLWGGEILRSFEAWPYSVKVIAASDLPVAFIQSVEYKAKPDRSSRNEKLATLKPPDWKQEIKPKPENAL